MKSLTKSLLLVSFLLVAFIAANAGDLYQQWRLQQLITYNWGSALFQPKKYAETPSTVLFYPRHETDADPHLATLKRTQALGFSMAAFGVGAIAGGGYMIYKGAIDLKQQQQKNIENVTPEKEQKKRDMTLVSTGVALAAVGLAIGSGGLVLGISSTVRRGKFNQSRHGVYLKATKTGMSLAYRF